MSSWRHSPHHTRPGDLVLEVLKYEKTAGPLHRLFESFQKVLIHDLQEDGFADIVAQTNRLKKLAAQRDAAGPGISGFNTDDAASCAVDLKEGVAALRR